jgi:NDP-sugar pyrophosphorylase family protein
MSAERLPVAILAGGLAQRLGALTQDTPKSLLDVNGEPFVLHQLRRLADQGVTHVVLCVGHLGEQIRAAVGTGSTFGLHVEYCFDGPRLLGTAGALRRALPHLGAAFFVLYGDSYLECDFGAVQDAYVSQGRAALMTIYRNEGRYDASNVEFQAGQIVAYDKRRPTPRMRHIDYGLGVLSATALAALPPETPCDLADLYAGLLQRKELVAFEVSERFYEIGSPAGLALTRQHLATRQPQWT